MPGPPPAWRFSSRLPAAFTANRLTRALDRHRRAGRPLWDLTESNPTRVGLAPSRAALEALLQPAARHYAPDAQGDLAAREALARDLARRRPGRCRPAPRDLFLTASTSEAYAWLFKLLCSPGEQVLVPAPGYPLFAHLAALEGVHAVPYPLTLEGDWRLDVSAVDAVRGPGTRAMVIISPHNPTGWVMSRAEGVALRRWAEHNEVVLISDEVFADFMNHRPVAVRPASAPCLALSARRGRLVSLGGLSKEAGLPQMKLSWLLLGGEPRWRRQARTRLAFMADHYLSVASPQQHALAAWLRQAEPWRRRLRRRLAANRGRLQAALAAVPATRVLPAAGGWQAVLRLPALLSDEDEALALLADDSVLVHPGYLYDFPPGNFLVISLLPEAQIFAPAVRRLAASLQRRQAGG